MAHVGADLTKESLAAAMASGKEPMEIAGMFGVSPATVRAAARHFGIIEHRWSLSGRAQCAAVVQAWAESGGYATLVAAWLDMEFSAVIRVLRKMKAHLRPEGRTVDDLVSDDSYVRGLFSEGVLLSDAAARLGCSPRKVQAAYRRLRLPLPIDQVRSRGTQAPDRQWLRDEYQGKLRTLDSIGDECGVSRQTVTNWLRDAGVQLRVPGRPTQGAASVQGGEAMYGPATPQAPAKQIKAA